MQCKCNPLQIERYLARISGPLLDQIDIHIEVPSVPFRELTDNRTGTDSAQMAPRQTRKHCRLDADAESLLKWDCRPALTTKFSASAAPLPTWSRAKPSASPT